MKSAASFAFARQVQIDDLKQSSVASLQVTAADFESALGEVRPAFGVSSDELSACRRGGLIPYGGALPQLQETAARLISQLRSSERTSLVSVLFEGGSGCGKTALAASLALESGFPFVRLVSPQANVSASLFFLLLAFFSLFLLPVSLSPHLFSLFLLLVSLSHCVAHMSQPHVPHTCHKPPVSPLYTSLQSLLGMNEQSKAALIAKIFEDAHRSPLSVVVLDELERILEYVRIGPRFSNVVLQTLLTCVKKVPSKNKVVVLATTSSADVLESLELLDAFNVTLSVPPLAPSQALTVLRELGVSNAHEVESVLASVTGGLPIKKLLLVVEMALDQGLEQGKDGPMRLDPSSLALTLQDAGLLV